MQFPAIVVKLYRHCTPVDKGRVYHTYIYIYIYNRHTDNTYLRQILLFHTFIQPNRRTSSATWLGCKWGRIVIGQPRRRNATMQHHWNIICINSHCLLPSSSADGSYIWLACHHHNENMHFYDFIVNAWVLRLTLSLGLGLIRGMRSDR